ncbi:MAG TPA: DUF4258 domain-containing protein [Patescibacteria group bacterium]|nr:DUF4258 domain-containing protein [Patescibacteria group bacterium]
MDNHFRGIIWTNHAIERMRERGILQGDAWATWNRPDQSRKGVSGNWVYYKNWSGTQIEVVAKQNDKKEWIILSVWSRMVNNRESKKTSFWSRIFGQSSRGIKS